jgi:nucleoside-diphosphate-sugar epimerase
MTTASTVLILGARGRFGQAAARAFARAGWQVLGQVRPGAQGPAIAGVHWLALEPSDTAALVQSGARRRRGGQRPEPRVHPQGLARASTRAAGISHPHQPGAGRHADDAGQRLQLWRKPCRRCCAKTRRRQATGVKGRIRIAMEQRLRAATQDGSLRAVVIRAGDFFGSGTGSWLDQAVAKDLAAWPRDLARPAGCVATPWAYLPDLANTFVKVAQQRSRLDAFAQLHFAGHTVTGQQWVDALTSVAWDQGWLPAERALRVQPHALAAAACGGPGGAHPCRAGRDALPVAHAAPAAQPDLCALIGDEPRTPFDDAVRQSLRDLGLLGRQARATPVATA